MDNATLLGLILQTIVILIGIFIGVMKINGRLIRVETRCDHIESSQEAAKAERHDIDEKVNGISRHVATIEGKISACRTLKVS